MRLVMSASRLRTAAVLAIAAVATLVLAAGVATPSIGAARPSERATPHVKRAAVVHNICKKSKIDVPACGVLWGLYTEPVPGKTHHVQHYASIEKMIGRRFDVVKNYIDWQPGVTFPNPAARALADNGKRILDFSWNAINYDTRASVSYQSIADGDWDKSVILPEARALKSFHHKVFIDFNHEFDSRAQSGKGSPAQYVAAYRHIHHVMREAGVRNVIWAWVSTGDIYHAKELRASYPGAKFVNWVGYDPYNFAQCLGRSWRSPYQTFHPFYRWLQHQAGMRKKPIMFGEYGSAPGPGVQAWYAGVAHALRRLPRVKAVMEFSTYGSSNCDFRLTDSTAALAGFTKSANSPYITGVLKAR